MALAQSLEQEISDSSEELRSTFNGNAALIVAAFQTESEVLNYTKKFINDLSLDPLMIGLIFS